MPIDPETPPSDLLEVSAAARILNFNPRKVWRLIAQGKLPALWVDTRWRLYRRDVYAFLAACPRQHPKVTRGRDGPPRHEDPAVHAFRDAGDAVTR